MFKPIATIASLLTVLSLSAAIARQDDPPAAGEEEVEKVSIKPDSALAALIKEAEQHEMAQAVAVNKAAAVAAKREPPKVEIPDWLRIHYLRNHPKARSAMVAAAFAPPDPTEGLPLALENLYTWMLLHQDLKPSAAPEAVLKAAASVTIGPNIRISGKNTTPNSESDIRINSGNPKQIIAASNNIGGSRQAQFFSSDGGTTWGQTTLPLLPGDSLHTDPTVDWATDGTAWATTIGIDAGTAGLQMRAYRSTDGGKAWTFDGTFSGEQTSADKQLMWIDRSVISPFKDNIYVIWHNNQPAFVNRRLSSGWEEPIQISGAETTGTAIGSDITTNAQGEVFAVWPDTGTRNLFIKKSVDGGHTFDSSAGIVARTFGAFDIGVPAFARRRVLIYASIAAFRTATRNEVYVSWTDLSGETDCDDPSDEPQDDVKSPCKTRVWIKRSLDGGLHWETAVKINNLSERSDQFNQRLAVDPNSGNLGIIYYKTGTGANRKKTNLFFQASNDHGETWSTPATKISSATTDETTVSADLGNQYGDYNGLSVADGVFFPCWTDRRDNKVEGIFTAKITLKTSVAGGVEPVLAAGPAPSGSDDESKGQAKDEDKGR